MPLPPPPPQSEHSRSVFRNNLGGETSWQRHQRYVQSARLYGQNAEAGASTSKKTDFDALKDGHRFIRDDAEDTSAMSYDDTVALKYYRSLFKEYACCDLKHYKRGDVALRWRTEGEVVSGAGQFTCGNTRCAYHEPAAMKNRQTKTLFTLELPFAYEEEGRRKSALVKVVLCRRCKKKLTWKRDQEKMMAYSKMADQELEKLDGELSPKLAVEEERAKTSGGIGYDSQDESDEGCVNEAWLKEKEEKEELRRQRRAERRSASPSRRTSR
ncbi:hypothetical protein FRB94_009040 [Tulasnella sp. JGI-2019a]|nr:hypothetical protein FRB93_003432 [Tulasnella sp. JGI-2019a]KAG9014882.1 hypothetical protein FRB94_009040 [Tulasnella sp. JGI-2019a]KAG9039956.1 hypothetical protein FRB95_004428 [Tulasnella sp. JGI-2019a]